MYRADINTYIHTHKAVYQQQNMSYDMKVKCLPQACVFKYLEPRWSCCLGKLWNLWDCGLVRRDGLLGHPKGHTCFWFWPSFSWSICQGVNKLQCKLSPPQTKLFQPPPWWTVPSETTSQTKSPVSCFSRVFCRSNGKSSCKSNELMLSLGFVKSHQVQRRRLELVFQKLHNACQL